ncbi:MAG TPA: imidazole glycerol phosphate synthase subunit HisH [Clostridiales bacterium]|nr:imidazole glycerol phosphate synthase subunit HisH [Clostridiales bacterium]
MIAIIDYGVGNLFSLKSSFAAIDIDAVITHDEKIIKNADHIILPGVGAFKEAISKLYDSGMDEVLKREIAAGKPVMGICLGMQLLVDKSFEHGEFEGLKLIDGTCVSIQSGDAKNLKIPHMGWNALDFDYSCPIFKYINQKDAVYFVHSYHVRDCNNVVATTEYGNKLTAAIAKDNLFGCQFHPEKSGQVGLNILRAFSEV